jgi:serine/threonine-protein kinase PRP4
VLGLNYDYALDIWSVACTLFELYSGKILFTGHSNNQMLRQIMDTLGRFPLKMVKTGQFAEHHFEMSGGGTYTFLETYKDRASGRDSVRKVQIPVKPPRDLKTRLLNDDERRRMAGNEEELKMVTALVDLLEKCLVLNPEKRLTVREALMHPFVTGKLK